MPKIHYICPWNEVCAIYIYIHIYIEIDKDIDINICCRVIKWSNVALTTAKMWSKSCMFYDVVFKSLSRKKSICKVCSRLESQSVGLFSIKLWSKSSGPFVTPKDQSWTIFHSLQARPGRWPCKSSERNPRLWWPPTVLKLLGNSRWLGFWPQHARMLSLNSQEF